MQPALATLSPTTVALVDTDNNTLTTYESGLDLDTGYYYCNDTSWVSMKYGSSLGACANQAEMYYNSGDIIWCDGSDLWAVGNGGSGGGGCGASGALIAGTGGSLQYNTSDNKYYFCDGSGWVEIDN